MDPVWLEPVLGQNRGRHRVGQTLPGGGVGDSRGGETLGSEGQPNSGGRGGSSRTEAGGGVSAGRRPSGSRKAALGTHSLGRILYSDSISVLEEARAAIRMNANPL